MRPIYPALLFFGLCGCVSLQALRGGLTETLDAQHPILQGVNKLDAICQAKATTENERVECVGARTLVRDGLRRQHSSISKLVGGGQ